MIERALTFLGASLLSVLFWVIGRVLLNTRIEALKESHELSLQFAKWFSEILEADDNRAKEATIQAVRHSDQMQELLNGYIPFEFQEAFTRRTHPNYQIVTNTLLRLSAGTAQSQEVKMGGIFILQYAGHLEHRIRKFIRDSSNPVICFREGVRAIVTLPVAFLQWMGLLSESKAERARQSLASTLLTFAVAFAGLVSTIMGIVTGWEAFTEIFTKFWKGHF